MRACANLLFVLSLGVSPTVLADAHTRTLLGGLPLHFEPNLGHTDSDVLFQARGRGHAIYFTADSVVFAMQDAAGRAADIRMELVGVNRDSIPSGLEKMPGQSNYFIGGPRQWKSQVPHFGKLQWEDAYPGVDLVFYGNPQQLEYDFILAPGAAPDSALLRFRGIDRAEVDSNGDLVLSLGGAKLLQRKPRIYQWIDGAKQTVEGSYDLRDEGVVGFKLADYDAMAELVIDPVIEFSTFVGGSRLDGEPSHFVDAEGAIYVVGLTESVDFPTTPNALDTTYNDPPGVFGRDFMVFKMDPTASSLIYSTFVGGSRPEQTHCDGHAITVDSAGNAYVSAETSSADFPTTRGAFDSSYAGGLDDGRGDAVAFKLSPDGSELLYSTYLGGSGFEEDACIDIDGEGSMYVAVQTGSVNYPITPGAFDTSPNGRSELAVTVLRPEGDRAADLLYSTYLGGPFDDVDPGIVVDDEGVINVIAESLSPGYPTTAGAFDETHNGEADVVVTRLRPAGQGRDDLVYSTFFGGSDDDKRDGRGIGVAVGPGGDLFITGETLTTQEDTPNPFPVTAGAFSEQHSASLPGVGENADMFVARLRPAGEGPADLVYSTFIGGVNADEDTAIAVDRNGFAYVAARTESIDLPLVNPVQSAPRSQSATGDVYLAVLDPSGAELVFATYLRGGLEDSRMDIFITEPSNSAVAASLPEQSRPVQQAASGGVAVYVAGETRSQSFPTTQGVLGRRLFGIRDLFITKIVDIFPPALGAVTTVSAASFLAPVAAGSIATAFAAVPVEASSSATVTPLPTVLDGISVQIIDSGGAEFTAELFFVGPTQVNLSIPEGVAMGVATFNLLKDGEVVATGEVDVPTVAPGLFFVGDRVAAAFFLIVAPDGSRSQPRVFADDLGPAAVDLGPEGTQVFLLLFGTGIRNATTVTATIGGQPLTVLGFVPQGDFVGLDQVNLGPIPRALIGRGDVELVLTVDGVETNVVAVRIQ